MQSVERPIFPKRTQDYLNHGAPVHQRNNELMHASCQFRDAGCSQVEAESHLVPRATQDGLSEHEAKATIRSAYRRPARAPLIGKPSNVVPYSNSREPEPLRFRKLPTKPEALPLPVSDGAIRLLESAFKPGEHIGMVGLEERVDKKGKVAVTPTDAGWVRTREEWIEDFAEVGVEGLFDSIDGVYIRANPFKDSSGKTDQDVSDFRHVLIEADQGTKEEQLGAIHKIGLPISAVTNSGNKSIHALVRIDAPDERTYREHAETLFRFCRESLGIDVDPKNRNPSRFSRLPAAVRARRDPESNQRVVDDDGNPILDRQELLETNIPGKPWEEWVDELPIEDGAQVITVDELLAFDRNNDPDNVLGKRWLCRGDSLVIGGATGIGKSSFLMMAIIFWALGKAFFGIVTKRPLTCLVIQAENNKGDLAIVFQDIVEELRLPPEQIELLKSRLHFRRQNTKTGMAFIEYARREIRAVKPDFVIADPMLSYIGCGINDQKEITQFLRNWLQPILDETGIIWAFIHHMGKPPKETGGKKPTSARALWSLLGSSDILNWAREVVSISELDWSQRTFEVEFGKRAPQANLCDANGDRIFGLQIKHSKSRVCWEPVDEAPQPVNATVVAEDEKAMKVRRFIIDNETVTTAELLAWAPRHGVGVNKAETIAKALAVNADMRPRIYRYKSCSGVTNRQFVYSTVSEADARAAAEQESEE